MNLHARSIIRNYANEDINSLTRILSTKSVSQGSSKVIASDHKLTYDKDAVTSTLVLHTSGRRPIRCNFRYTLEGDEVCMNSTIPRYAAVLANAFNQEERIVAADEDDEGFDYDDEGDYVDEKLVEDTVDDLEESVEEFTDLMTDFEEDDIDIEIEANISNRYIAQCDGCQDVFISALEETDQIVDKISGVCPMCEKSTDQYLKWIVREV